jgi:hypothetical protein
VSSLVACNEYAQILEASAVHPAVMYASIPHLPSRNRDRVRDDVAPAPSQFSFFQNPLFDLGRITEVVGMKGDRY